MTGSATKQPRAGLCGCGRRRTKIVATLGPASRDEEALGQLLEAGMDVARINLSHGSMDQHAAAIATARRLAAERAVPLAVLIDLPGPKLRLGDLPGPLAVSAGQTLTLGVPPAAQIPVNFPELLPCFTPGELVLIDDGAMALRVSAVAPGVVTLEPLNDGVVTSRKGVNLPDTQLPAGALTDADHEFLAWGLRQDVDYVALSFVRGADDVRELKELIAAAGGAAHLAGVLAAHTFLPVIGVPVKSGALDGLDALLSTVQMPDGIPVATVALGSAGAVNAAILAIQILALRRPELAVKLQQHKRDLKTKVKKGNAQVQFYTGKIHD